MHAGMMAVAEATMSLAVTTNLPHFVSGKAQDVRGRNPGSYGCGDLSSGKPHDQVGLVAPGSGSS